MDGIVTSSIIITCSAENGAIASLTCSYDSGSRIEDCRKLVQKGVTIMHLKHYSGAVNGTFSVDGMSFTPGSHSLVVVATSDDGEMDTSDIITFTVATPLRK